MDEVIFDQCMRGLDPDGADRFLGFSDGIGSKEKSIIDRHMVAAQPPGRRFGPPIDPGRDGQAGQPRLAE